MSITEEDDRVTTYQPVVATTDFPAGFDIFDNDDLTVLVDGVERTDFTVSATYVQGVSSDAKAVFTPGITGTVQVIGLRSPHRQSEFQAGGPLPIPQLNSTFNLLQAQAQEARRDIGRSLKVAVGEDNLDPLPTPEAGKLMRWRQDLKGFENATSESQSVAAAEAALAAFQTQYLGAFPTATEPTTDLEGGALVAGALYWNTTDGTLKVWSGTAWVAQGTIVDGSVTDTKVAPASKLYRRVNYDLISAFDAMSKPLAEAVNHSEVTDSDAAEISAAANNLIVDVGAAGGGTILLPRGLYTLTDTVLSLTQHAAIELLDKVYLRGAGRGATVLKLADGANCHVLFQRGRTDFGASHLTIDGNRDNQALNDGGAGAAPTGCGFYNSATRALYEHLHIKNTYDYSIGVELGRATDCTWNDILVEDAGADGMDFKNTTEDSTGNVVNRLTVRRHGLQSESTENFAGLDIRGQVMASKIRIEQLGYNDVNDVGRTGIRFMGSEEGDSGGVGGHKSSLSQFHIEGIDGTPTANVLTRGLFARARNTTISHGYISGCPVGIERDQRETSISQVTVEECRRGAVWQHLSGDTSPVNGVTTALTVRDCTEVGLQLSADVDFESFVGCVLRGSAKNLDIAAGATGNIFSGGHAAAPTGSTNVSDAGTDTVFDNVVGYRTANRVRSPSFALDSTGLKTVTIPHGLDTTPSVDEVQLTLLTLTGAGAFRIGFLRARSTDATNINAEVYVSTADSTAGTVGYLVADVKTKIAKH